MIGSRDRFIDDAFNSLGKAKYVCTNMTSLRGARFKRYPHPPDLLPDPLTSVNSVGMASHSSYP